MRVVWVSDYSGRPVATGFSRASAEILKYLHGRPGFEVVEVGVGYQGHGEELPPPPWPVVSTTAYGGRLEGQDTAAVTAEQFKADVMVLFMDAPDAAWAVTYVDRSGKPLPDRAIEILDKRPFALAMYSPVDGQCPDGRVPHSWRKIYQGLNTFDAAAAPSRFGQKLLTDAFGFPAAYLPHGVDTGLFRPQGEAAQARQALGMPPGNLTLIYVAVNKLRKMVPAFFETAAKLLERRPDLADGTNPHYKGLTVVFHGQDRDNNYDIEGLEGIYGLDRHNVFVYRTENLPDQGLAVLYRAADLFVGLSGGEGFGIPAIEAQASRVPALVTDYSAQSETVPDAEMGWCKVPPKSLIPMPFNNLMWAWPDTDAAADRIAAFVADKGLRVRLRRAAWEWAQEYSWPRVLPKVEEWLAGAVESRKQYADRVRIEAVVV